MLEVRNWAKFQHYKDRKPPWIKLATDTFQNPDFARLQTASKLLAICIWTLASKTSTGLVPDQFEYISQWGFLGSDVTRRHMEELVKKGFLIRHASKDASPEAEAYTQETETDPKPHDNQVVSDSFETLWNAWPRHDKRSITFKKFKSVVNGEYQLVLSRAFKQIELWKIENKEKRYIPMLCTWLHQKRFDTEPELFETGNAKRQLTDEEFTSAMAEADRELAARAQPRR